MLCNRLAGRRWLPAPAITARLRRARVVLRVIAGQDGRGRRSRKRSKRSPSGNSSLLRPTRSTRARR